jgi:hypothetical protein
MAPLASSTRKKDCAKNGGQKPPCPERPHSSAAQTLHGQVNGQTAREQTDCEENGDTQDILRLRPGNALSDVEDVGNNKDGENRSLGGDQAVHSYGTPPWKSPSSHRCVGSAHGNDFLLVTPIGIVRMLQVP